jgi:hypothetical protein
MQERMNQFSGGDFTKAGGRADNRRRNLNSEEPMPLSGEAIRLMNYVDDVTVTLRRVLALAQTLTPEERKRVSEYLRNAQPSVETVVSSLQGK